MNIPYRTRQGLKRTALVLLVILLFALLVWGCWLLWIQDFIVYSQQGGAQLNFDLPPVQSGEPALPPEDQETISIYYNEGDNAINVSSELTQIVGYFVEEDAMGDLAAVRTQIQSLSAGTAVMVDVKNIYGEFYYSSAVGAARSNDVDTQAMDELITYLKSSGMYTIARVPALRDYTYGLNHVPDGLHHSSRGYLWQDDEGCYWLDPTSEGTVSYLVQIVNELKALGFQEVVFTDFYVPDNGKVYFNADRAETLKTVAGTVLTSCATDYFTVSFVSDMSFSLPEGRCRLYMLNAEAANAATIAQQTGFADPAVRLVFLTEVHDTRFDAYSVLRPLSAAH